MLRSWPATAIGILVLTIVMAPPSASAQVIDRIAEQAAAVHDKHCAKIKVTDDGLAAQRLATVSRVWDRVSKGYAELPDPILLYWRGRLAACLNQDEAAREDLGAFLAEVGDEPVYQQPAERARAILRRRDGATGAVAPSVPAFVVGGD